MKTIEVHNGNQLLVEEELSDNLYNTFQTIMEERIIMQEIIAALLNKCKENTITDSGFFYNMGELKVAIRCVLSETHFAMRHINGLLRNW